MYLTERKTSGKSRPENDHQEVEMLLESYHKICDEIVEISGNLISNIRNTEEVVRAILDANRNSLMLLDLYQKTERSLDGIPIHHVIGNHDVFGRDPASNITLTDPLYGKKAFEQAFKTKTYRSFDQAGYHFILLDSIQITPTGPFGPAGSICSVWPGFASQNNSGL